MDEHDEGEPVTVADHVVVRVGPLQFPDVSAAIGVHKPASCCYVYATFVCHGVWSKANCRPANPTEQVAHKTEVFVCVRQESSYRCMSV